MSVGTIVVNNRIRNIKQFRNKNNLLIEHYSCKLGTILQFWVCARNIMMQNRNNISLFSYSYTCIYHSLFFLPVLRDWGSSRKNPDSLLYRPPSADCSAPPLVSQTKNNITKRTDWLIDTNLSLLTANTVTAIELDF